MLKLLLVLVLYAFKSVASTSLPERPVYLHDFDGMLQSYANVDPSRVISDSNEDSIIAIINGTVHVKKFKHVYETRRELTAWGFVQLIEWAKRRGRSIPDFVVAFNHADRPTVRRPFDRPPLPELAYCTLIGRASAIPWPDWAFWGWSHVNMEKWDTLTRSMFESELPYEDRIQKLYYSAALLRDTRKKVASCMKSLPGKINR